MDGVTEVSHTAEDGQNLSLHLSVQLGTTVKKNKKDLSGHIVLDRKKN